VEAASRAHKLNFVRAASAHIRELKQRREAYGIGKSSTLAQSSQNVKALLGDTHALIKPVSHF
jgi:hypothetical protein